MSDPTSPRLTPSFFVYPTQYRIPSSAIQDVDDLIDGFEGTTLQGWTQNKTVGATIAKATTPKQMGQYSLRLYAPTLADYCWVHRDPLLEQTGEIAVGGYVYIVSYVGSSGNAGQVFEPYDTTLSKPSIGFYFYATMIGCWHGGVGATLRATPLSTNTWHKFKAAQNFATKVSRFWINDELLGTWTDATVYPVRRIYVGDLSNSIQCGDFYWDAIRYGRVA